MSLTLPAFTYALPLEGAPRQSVTGADRPACAFVAALAAWERGQTLMGQARKLTDDQIAQCFRSGSQLLGVHLDRMCTWAAGVNHERIPQTWPRPISINGLTLSQYQLDAEHKLTIAGGVLNLGVGLGKTLTTAAMAEIYQREGLAMPSRCWIVAPLIAHGAWKPYLPYLKSMYRDVRVLSIDSIHKFKAAAPEGGLLIVDEAHLAGRMTARRTSSLMTLRLGFDVGLCLTGTLVHGGLEKALTVLDLAVPGAAGFSSRWTAGDYFKVLVRKKIGSRTVTSLEKPTGALKNAFMEWVHSYSCVLSKDSPAVAAEVCIPGQELHTVEIGDTSQHLKF